MGVQGAGQPLAGPPRGQSVALATEGSGVCKGTGKHTPPSGPARVGIGKPPAALRDKAQVPAEPVGGSRAAPALSLTASSHAHKTPRRDLTRQQWPLNTSQGAKAKPVQLSSFWGALSDMRCCSGSCHMPPRLGHTCLGPHHRAPQ